MSDIHHVPSPHLKYLRARIAMSRTKRRGSILEIRKAPPGDAHSLPAIHKLPLYGDPTMLLRGILNRLLLTYMPSRNVWVVSAESP